jgi:hypothetical protein
MPAGCFALTLGIVAQHSYSVNRSTIRIWTGLEYRTSQKGMGFVFVCNLAGDLGFVELRRGIEAFLRTMGRAGLF